MKMRPIVASSDCMTSACSKGKLKVDRHCISQAKATAGKHACLATFAYCHRDELVQRKWLCLVVGKMLLSESEKAVVKTIHEDFLRSLQ